MSTTGELCYVRNIALLYPLIMCNKSFPTLHPKMISQKFNKKYSKSKVTQQGYEMECFEYDFLYICADNLEKVSLDKLSSNVECYICIGNQKFAIIKNMFKLYYVILSMSYVPNVGTLFVKIYVKNYLIINIHHEPKYYIPQC